MRRYYMKQKLKSAVAFLIILILLPYVVSVFVNGTDTEASRRQENSFVRVNTADAEGNVQTVEIGWTGVPGPECLRRKCRRTVEQKR